MIRGCTVNRPYTLPRFHHNQLHHHNTTTEKRNKAILYHIGPRKQISTNYRHQASQRGHRASAYPTLIPINQQFTLLVLIAVRPLLRLLSTTTLTDTTKKDQRHLRTRRNPRREVLWARGFLFLLWERRRQRRRKCDITKRPWAVYIGAEEGAG